MNGKSKSNPNPTGGLERLPKYGKEILLEWVDGLNWLLPCGIEINEDKL